jgi:chlorobactene glucosyltransferase
MSLLTAVVASAPWLLLPPIALLRATRSRSLNDESESAPVPAPRISVIVPARNERRHIEHCVRSVLASTYPVLEVIVVDDHSDDGTGTLAREIARSDARLRVIDTPPLPEGWFGKQWACTSGAAAAMGDLLLFADADTRHAADLVTRAVNAMQSRGADLLSVAGHQEMHGFWERLVQPQVFWMLLARYGGTEIMNRATRASDVIANGQCILVRREAYISVGGHAAVRDKVAEDLALAQCFFRAGRRVAIVLGLEQLSTHMYGSLGELVHGWGKNVFAGGIDAMPGGAVGRLLFPFVLVLVPLMGVLPAAALLLATAGALDRTWLLWSALCVGSSVLWWVIIYSAIRQPRRYAPLYPLGAAVVLYIVLGAIARGRRVGWKGRVYVAR